MAKQYHRIANYNVSVKEIDGKVVFLRKLAKGGSEHSFGIHVAKLAGLPAKIVDRANEVLHQLEAANMRDAVSKSLNEMSEVTGKGVQLSIFQLDDPVLSQVRDQILNTDINNLTPMEALNKLHHIKNIITGKNS